MRTEMMSRMPALLGLAVIGLAAMSGSAHAQWGPGDDGRHERVIRCESQDNRTRVCGVDVRGGVRLLRQLSRAACIEGHSWGRDRRGIWVTRGCRGEFALGGGYDDRYDARYGDGDYRNYGNGGNRFAGQRIRCESRDNRPGTCAVDTRGGVRLVKQISKAACVRGRTWGQDRYGVWVSDGCRGEFEIGAGGGYGRWNDDSYRSGAGRPGAGSYPGVGYGRTLVCESNDNRYRNCRTEGFRRAWVVRKISRAACDFDVSWGYSRDGIWVDRGCRAEFALD